jgi:hypothetical protein
MILSVLSSWGRNRRELFWRAVSCRSCEGTWLYQIQLQLPHIVSKPVSLHKDVPENDIIRGYIKMRRPFSFKNFIFGTTKPAPYVETIYIYIILYIIMRVRPCRTHPWKRQVFWHAANSSCQVCVCAYIHTHIYIYIFLSGWKDPCGDVSGVW